MGFFSSWAGSWPIFDSAWVDSALGGPVGRFGFLLPWLLAQRPVCATGNGPTSLFFFFSFSLTDGLVPLVGAVHFL